MAKLVTKFKYLKPNRKKKGGYAQYIATREGVEKIDDSQKNEPATTKQQQFIEKITADFPEVKELLEYEDYTAKPTVGNASELISIALEQTADSILDSKTYADYIATRPRSQRFGKHGLFSDEGITVNLRKVSEEMNQHEGNVWTAIISLRREDAQRLGYDSGERWRDMLRAHTQEFSNQFHIPLENLRWFAAFHNEGNHPHVHMILYSTDKSYGYLSKEGVQNLRSTLGKEIFAQDLLTKYKEQTAHRDSLRTESKELVAKIISQINQGDYDNPVLENKMLDLSKILSETSGKKVYGYLKADTKALVDEIVDEIADDDRISQLYELWYQDKDFIKSTYTDEPAKRVPLSQNEEFKPIRNAVIREALNISEDRFTVEDEEEIAENGADSIDIPFDEADEKEPSRPRLSEFERLKKKAAAENMYSQYTLAKLLLDRNGEYYEPEAAVDWLKQSAKIGNAVAKYRLGKLFLLGEDVLQSTNEALSWLNSASDDGYEYAQYLLGKLYAEGKYVEKDVFFALLYLEKAAMQNNPYAEYLAGKLYLTDEENRDTYRAVKCFSAAAENGNCYAEYILGKMYLYGNGVERDVDIALSYLNSSAEHGNEYESKKHHNAVFVGYDTNGIPRHAHKRGTGSESTYKGNAPNGAAEYSFHWHGMSKYICLFESPIDMLSFISMHKNHWQEHSFAAACSVSDRVLFQMLADNPNLQEVFLCLDNDEAGQKATKRISDKLFLKGIKSTILLPEHKDWNEDLLSLRAEEKKSEVAEPCQMSLS